MAAPAFSLALSLLSPLLLLLTTVEAQQSRAPHGLEYESPMSLSPSAFDFFHPSRNHHASAPCTDSQCAHQLAALSASSKAGADPVQGSSWPTPASNRRVRAGNVAAIVTGLAFVVLVAVVASYVVARRRANVRRQDSGIIIKT